MDKKPEIIHAAEPFMIKGGPVGCLLIHGYTGTPFEMRLLARSLAEDGYTILAPRLFGHATSPEDLLRARYWDWIADVEDALDILKGITDHQVVLGLSMGGILAMIAAARYQVDGVVSFSTPSNLPQDLRVKFLPWFYWLMPRQPRTISITPIFRPVPFWNCMSWSRPCGPNFRRYRCQFFSHNRTVTILFLLKAWIIYLSMCLPLIKLASGWKKAVMSSFVSLNVKEYLRLPKNSLKK